MRERSRFGLLDRGDATAAPTRAAPELPFALTMWAGCVLVALLGAPAAARELAGGWSEAPASAKITALAQYSLRSLAEEFCASSNAFGCSRLQGATFVSVTSAHTQVVAGTNYEICLLYTSPSPRD